MKNNYCFCVLSFFVSMMLFGQEVKIHVQEICEFKPIYNAKVVLKGNAKPDIEAKFDKTQKCYILRSIPDGYDAIIAYHKKYDAERLKITGGLPNSITLKLQCKNNIVLTDSVFGNPRQTSHYARYVNVRDDYKILIALKDSYLLPYGDVRKKIDSLVAPFGLEYINDLVPETCFFQIDGRMVSSMANDWLVSRIDSTKSLAAIINDPNNHDFFEGAGSWFSQDKALSQKCYYVLAYRKKSKKAFALFDDELVEAARKSLPQLQFGNLCYQKFNALYPEENTTRPWKFMACSKLNKYDKKMMNYQFIKRFGNDSTRVLFMDYTLYDVYLDKNGINNRGDMTVVAVPEYTYWHEFLLDRPRLDYRIWQAKSYYFDMEGD